jgi:hypothetical protein
LGTQYTFDLYFISCLCGVHPIHDCILVEIKNAVDYTQHLEHQNHFSINVTYYVISDKKSRLAWKNPADVEKLRVEQDICSIWLGRPLIKKEQSLVSPVFPAMGVMVPLAAVDIA